MDNFFEVLKGLKIAANLLGWILVGHSLVMQHFYKEDPSINKLFTIIILISN